ncbi:TetR family transcriptional regulator [Streptomyces sp. NPDC003860]
MAKQERAQKTREGLLRSAATQFDRDGYNGASLARISEAAQISMGALTFHFSTKADLADAVEEAGRAMVLDAVERIGAQHPPSLGLAMELTLELTRLLQEQEVVRAAARLTRERPGRPEWSSAWLPELRRILNRLDKEGGLPATAPPDLLTTLASCLVDGMDAALRRSGASPVARVDAVGELTRLWRLVLAGLRQDGDLAGLP